MGPPPLRQVLKNLLIANFFKVCRDAVSDYNPTTIVMLLQGGWSIATEESNHSPLLIGAAQRGLSTPVATYDPAVAPPWAAQVVSRSPCAAFQEVSTPPKLLTVVHSPCAGGVAQHRVFA